jgi:hypothetical protein
MEETVLTEEKVETEEVVAREESSHWAIQQ